MIDKEVVEKAVAALRDLDSYRHFFGKISIIDWIEPLYNKGFFKCPPSATGEVGFGPFVDWPESQYLRRVASKATDDRTQKLLCDIILQAPETNNILVHEDFANITLALPTQYAEKWAKHEIDWLVGQNALGFAPIAECLVALARKLAEAEHQETALGLMRNLLDVKPDPNFDYDRNEARDPFSEPNPRILIDAWLYAEALKRSVPWLSEHTGLAGLRLIRDLLRSAVRHSLANPERVGTQDFSCVWRPAIEDHEQNRQHDGIREALIDAICDLGEALVPKFGKNVFTVIEGDWDTSYNLFLRIGLHLRCAHFAIDPAGTEVILSKPEIYDDHHLHHELYRLLNAHFGSLSAPTQSIYIQFIRDNPQDREQWAEHVEKATGKLPTDDDWARYTRQWRYSKLHPIESFLDDDLRAEFGIDDSQAMVGEDDHPDFESYITFFQGPTSPITAQEIAALSDDGLIEKLKTWEPSKGFFAPTPEGLARTMQKCVPENPDRFVGLAERFQSLAPPYVRGLISGFRDAAEKVLEFDWNAILSLCKWVVDQPIMIPGRRKLGYDDIDPHWGPTWMAIADLVQIGFNISNAEIPFRCRDELWHVIVALADLSFPEIKVGTEVVDPTITPDLYRSLYPDILGIRQKGLNCVVRFALWVSRHVDDGREKQESAFSTMPEVRELLDRKLDEREKWVLTYPEPFGRWFPWLLKLDYEWTLAAFNRIFPTAQEKVSLRAAAWLAYMNHTNAYGAVFDLMRPHYLWALEQLGTKEYGEFWSFAEKRLAQEIMIFYWRGRIGFEESDHLLEFFFEKAPSELRQEALSFIGRSLREADASPASAIQSRLQLLWEWWFGKLKTGTISEHAEEIGTFAWWFASAKLDTEWSLEQVKKILRVKARSQALFMVLNRLVALAADFPVDVVECIGLLVEYVTTDADRWLLDARGVRKAFESVLTATNEKTLLAEVERITNRLGTLGYPWNNELRPLADELRKHRSPLTTS